MPPSYRHPPPYGGSCHPVHQRQGGMSNPILCPCCGEVQQWYPPPPPQGGTIYTPLVMQQPPMHHMGQPRSMCPRTAQLGIPPFRPPGPQTMIGPTGGPYIQVKSERFFLTPIQILKPCFGLNRLCSYVIDRSYTVF